MLFSSSVFASFKFDDTLSSLPILHEGRVKPLISFAESSLVSLCGKKYIDNLTPVEWLLELFFIKKEAHDRKIFFVDDFDLLLNIDVKPNHRNMYSLNDLAQPLIKNIYLIKTIDNIDYSLRTRSQKALLKLYSKILFVLQLDLLTVPLFYDKQDHNGIKLNYELQQYLRQNTDVYLFPLSFDLWVNLDTDNSTLRRLDFVLMNDILNSCMIHDYSLYKMSALQLLMHSYSFLDNLSQFRIKAEVYYTLFSPVFVNFCLYFFAFIFCILGFMRLFSKYNFNLAVIFFSLALFVHLLSIFTRIFITQRAPVATLFESILFVNFVLALITFIIYLLNKNYKYIFLICGLMSSCILQYIVYMYEFDGDTIKVLLPVLNTNFWLTVHVITISIGYAFCLLSAVVAHIFLFDYVFNFNNKCFNSNLKILNYLCVIAVFFSALGTILGGIWADQSWGRFWGWDPKENGALLIVLWLIFVLHFRFTSFFSLILFFIFTACNGIMVFMAWFGVNLLNSGLHSYGFVQNIGKNLFLYCLIESFFISGLFFIYVFRKKSCRANV